MNELECALHETTSPRRHQCGLVNVRTASFHAQVHMIYEGRFTEQWGANEARTCKLTFIGKNLDHDGLR